MGEKIMTSGQVLSKFKHWERLGFSSSDKPNSEALVNAIKILELNKNAIAKIKQLKITDKQWLNGSWGREYEGYNIAIKDVLSLLGGGKE